MSFAEQLAMLRPLMTPAEIEAILGKEQKKRALTLFNDFTPSTGVEISFSHRDGVIDTVRFLASSGFSENVAVCGVCCGMTIEALRRALPEIRLADGETGEPNVHGYIRYQSHLNSTSASIHIAIKDAKVAAITLTRSDIADALARRKAEEAERRAESDRKLLLANQWKSIKDPDEMLLTWADHCSPWQDYSPERFVAFARWLIALQEPDIWHIVAMRWNWDYSHAPLLWIIRQKNCDIATALEIFFLADPDYYFRWVDDRASVPASNLELFDFLMEIRERLAQGFYVRSEIMFDGEDRVPFFAEGLTSPQILTDKAKAARFFPREAQMKFAGRDPAAGSSDKISEAYAILSTVA